MSCCIFLASNYPNSKIIISHRAYAMRPEDDSHFVNELFMPSAVDDFYEMPTDKRQKVIKDYWHVTHNGVTKHDRTPTLTIDIHTNNRHHSILYIYQYKSV
ncbi:SidA/IucD/PvdA family monooxygenase [Gynuella sunshinyii]|uniref:SidA/IucD/PvdA family monooxygenase n=1 Tax=Gynuella sunshinyii TaxID=1445505 RepID=UPI003CCBA647